MPSSKPPHPTPPDDASTAPAKTAGPKTAQTKAKTTSTKAKTTSTKKVGRALPVVNATFDTGLDDAALTAQWPEAVLALSDEERQRRVRRGLDTVVLDEVGEGGKRRTRGFVRAVLRVPLDHPKARVYGVFVELDRDGYLALQRAFSAKEEARVWGRLATRLPFLDDAFGTEICILEDGSDRRARVVDVKSESLRHGPEIGPRVRRF